MCELITCRKCLSKKEPRYFIIMGADERVCDFCYKGTEKQRKAQRVEKRKSIAGRNKTLVLAGYADSPLAKRVRSVTTRKEALLEAARLKKELADYD